MTVAVLQFQTDQGPAGAPGSGGAVTMLWDTGTSDADPGDGQISVNNANFNNVTQAYIDDLAFGGGSISAWVDSFSDVGAAALRGTLMLQTVGAPGNLAIYNVIGSVTAGSGYRKVTLEHVTSDGAFEAGDRISVNFTPAGSDSAVSLPGLAAPQYVRDLVALRLSAHPGSGADDPAFDNRPALVELLAAAGPYQAVKLDSNSRYAISANITLGNFAKIEGNGSRITPMTGDTSSTLLTTATGLILQQNNRSILSGLILDGSSDGSTPTLATVDARTNLGLSIKNHAALVLQDVEVCHFKTGARIDKGQFLVFRAFKAWNCGVGLYSRTDPTEGGNNSNSFYDLQIVGCMVGGIFYLDPSSPYPNHTMQIYNDSTLDSHICGLAFIGKSETLSGHVIIIGGAPENTDASGLGAATYSYDGLTIPKCGIYGSYADIRTRDRYIAEAVVSPVFKLENHSKLLLDGISGYGNTVGKLTEIDATSEVHLTGQQGAGACTITGVVENHSAYAGATGSTLGNLIQGPFEKIPSNIQNDAVNPARGDVGAAMSPATGSNGVSGVQPYREAVFDATAGSSGANCQRYVTTGLTANVQSGLIVYAYDIMSDVDRDYFCGWFTNQKNQNLYLKAGIWQRVVHFAFAITATANVYYVAARAGLVATVRIQNWHMLTGNDTPTNRALLSKIAQGHFNAKRRSVGTAAPATTPNWPDGEQFLDQTNHKVYISDGVSASTDWRILN